MGASRFSPILQPLLDSAETGLTEAELGITYTLAGYLGREFFGIILSMPLGLLGVLLGWGTFVMFASPTDWHFWFWSIMGGAGVLAALGASVAWLLGTTPRPALASISLFTAIAAAGVVGAYLGYHWGQTVDTPCCAQPDNSVFGYTASGAMAGALMAATVLGIISQRVWRLPRAPFLTQDKGDSDLSRASGVSEYSTVAAASMASTMAMDTTISVD